MKAYEPLIELADKLQRGSATSEDTAELIRMVSGEQRLGVLEAVLPLNYDCAGAVLQRITELVPDDPKAYLSLALWKYNNGLDDQALDLLEKARHLAPRDQDVLRADVWFSYLLGPNVIREKCRALLDAFPNDEWAKDINRRISKDEKITSLESPDWNNRWQDLVNGTRQPGPR